MTFALAATLLASTLASPIDKTLDEMVQKSALPGAVVVVRLNGKRVYSRAVGFSNLETKTKMGVHSVHELASVSKQFTATAVMLMVEKRKLKLSDTLDKFVSGAPESWKKVTVEHLLHHTSGLPDYLAPGTDVGSEVTLGQIVERIKPQKMRFEPGSKWEYSNTGFALLGMIVDNVSGSSFHDVVRKQVFAPAGMKTAVISDPGQIMLNRAYGYTLADKVWKNEGLCSAGYSGLGDGMVSCSASDLVKWHETLKARRILSDASWKYLWTPSKQSISNKSPYACGFGVVREGEQPKLAHSGGWLGTTTYFMSDLKSDSAVIVLVNSDSTDFSPIVKAAKEQFPGLN